MVKQYLTLVITLSLCGLFSSIAAQSTDSNAFAVFSGTVELQEEPAIGATVQIQGLDLFAVTDIKGVFSITNLPFGEYTVQISYVGSEAFSQTVLINQTEVSVNFALEDNTRTLEEVTVKAQSKQSEIRSQPISISSLDAKAVNSQALGAEELLKRSTGVVVRQQGGLGSETNINLNGLSGRSVRVYYDGIPLEVYGGGIQINNIPVDALQRMDVYKGVMPVAIGTDALGGGINLVPFQSFDEYLRASYTIGSFNTHRLTLGGRKNINDKLSLSLLSYLNYSDNDFTMRDIRSLNEVTLDNGTVTFQEEVIDAKRFHNQHFSAFIEGTATLKDLAWADRLSLSVAYSDRDDQVQHGRVLQAVAIGEANRQVESISQRLDYRKRLLNDKLSIRYFGLFSRTQTITQDSTTAVYNWKGQRLQSIENATGAEIFPIPSQREGTNIGTAHRVALSYQIIDKLSLTLSDFYRYSEIDGEDPVGARISLAGESIDPNTIPSRLWRNIFGAEIKSTLFNDKLTAVAFYKNYYYKAESIDILQRTATIIPVRSVNENFDGYGFALKYQILSSLYLRGSYEQATRIPTEGEIFGDFGAVVPNYTIRPENSDNWNLGFRFEKPIVGLKQFYVQVDGFIRNQKNLIRLDDFGPENAIFVNEAKVDGRGIEVATALAPTEQLKLSANFTYQSNEITTPQLSVGALSGAQVPNIPNLFYNVGVSYGFENIFSTSGDLEVFWNYFFVDRFSINEVKDLDSANPEFVIPQQHLHNVGLVYAPSKKGVSFSLTVRNVFNNKIFDNFRIPRPGINYTFKINYLL